MPKRKADSSLKGVPKLSCDSSIAYHTQADYIEVNSFVTATPCDYCLSAGIDYMMDRSRCYLKCASCTRAGRSCKREFYTSRE